MVQGEPKPPQKASDPKGPDGPPRWNQRTWVWFLFFVLSIVICFSYFGDRLGKQAATVNLNRFLSEVSNGNVENIKEVDEGKFEATLHTPILWKPGGTLKVPEQEYERIIVVGVDKDIEAMLVTAALERDTSIELYPKDAKVLTFMLVNLFPIFLLIGIFWFMTSRVRKQMGPGIFGRFTGNRAKRYERGKESITFEEVAGLKNVKAELQEIVSFLKNPERFTRLGAKIPKGVLLVGPPGTGKTLLARAVAGEADVPFFSISGSEFIEMFVGIGASRVRELFDEAKKNAPCIIFIDEIDAVGRSRGAGLGGGHDEREQTLNQILSEMDGFESHHTVIVLAATNRPDVLDPALVRPGRFDRQVVVERPQREGRKAILEVHTRKIPLSEDVDLDTIARGTIGFSGADLENLANEAALLAARTGQERVCQQDFMHAKDKIVLGMLRDEAVTEKEKRITAYHEAGHALLAMLLPEADPLQSVTIVPRGRALGVTMQLPVEELHSYSRTYLTNRVVIALGGRAAEELIFSEFTTGSENDLDSATSLVERMVCRWGMSEKLGPVSFKRGEEHVFLGRELAEGKHFSEHTAMLIDDEIRRLVGIAYEKATKILDENRDKLVKMAEELLQKEVLSAVEVYELFEMPLPPHLQDTTPSRSPKKASQEKSAPSPSAEEIDPDLLGLEGAS
ncbi:MAG: ATP-dependent zinc metalloprotease FtsH [Planctomycetota bacterium]